MSLRRLACLAFLAYVLAVPALADDEKILVDWKEVEKKGRDAIKARAEFWSAKGVTGKDLYWLAKMWEKGGDGDKAVEVYEQYLAVPDTAEKNNREPATWNATQILIRKRAWDKIGPWCERLRKEFPNSAVKHQSFHEQGRAFMMLGDPEKALEYFTQAAELGLNNAVIDIAEYQMSEGKVDEAKATLAKYIAQAPPGKDKALREVEEAFGMLGTQVPALDGAVSIGRTEAPLSWEGKPVLLYHWHMSTPQYDAHLKLASDLARSFGEHAHILGISGYNKFNPETKKVEQDLSEEQEQKLYRIYIEQTTEASPPCLLLPDALKQALHQTADAQLTVVSPEGKIVWFSVNKEAAIYRWLRAQAVLKKLAGG